MGSVKQLPFLPTIPAEDRPVRVKIMSPLQDANRYAYKTNTPAAVSNSYDNQLFTVTPGKPISYNIGSTTENNFHIFDNHLNAEFKKIKHQQQHQQQQQQYKPGKKHNLRIIGESMLTTEKAIADHNNNPSHSFFTIEDAVTASPHYYMKNHRGKSPAQKQQQHHHRKPEYATPTQSADIMSTIQSNLEYFRTVTTTYVPETTPSTTTSTTTTPAPAPLTTVADNIYEMAFPTQEPTMLPRQRTKLRRKKPRPHFANVEQELETATSNIVTNSWEYTRGRHRVRGRPSADMEAIEEGPTEANVIENSVTEENSNRLRDRVKFPSRHRFADSTTSSPVTRTTTSAPQDRENQLDEVITTTGVPVTTPGLLLDGSTSDDHLRHRTRFRYKPRTRPTFATTTTTSTESSLNEELNLEDSTDIPMEDSEEKMILSLMNNVAKGQGTEDSLTTLSPLQTRIRPITKFDTKNRPRFSVKDYRNRQNGTSTTKAEPSSTTPSANLRTRNKYIKDEMENRVNKRLSTLVPRRKPLGNRLDLNKYKSSTSEASTSVETTPSTQTIAQTTPMTIKLRNSFRNRDKNRFSVVTEKVAQVENEIVQPEEDMLVRSESNHYGKDSETVEETQLVEKVTEKSHETSIMKIAKDDHSYRSHVPRPSTTPSALAELMNTIDNESNLLQRVSDLTVTSGQSFANSVNTKHVSRKIPNYFTIATEDPILPIEAFFPNVINKD